MPRHLWLALLIASGAAAQPSTLSFTPLGSAEGLSSFAATALETDTDGYMWLGTTDNADRYDGARARAFPIGTEEQEGYVRALYAEAASGEGSASGAIWAGSEGGLWRRPAKGEGFGRIVFNGVETGEVPTLEADGAALWVGTSRAGLLRLEGGAARHYSASGGQIAGDSVRAVVKLTSGILAVATRSGLSWLDLEAARVRHDRTLEDVETLAEAAGSLWAGRLDGTVVRFSPGGTKRDEIVVARGSVISALEPSTVYPWLLWVGTKGEGLYLLDARTGTRLDLPDASGLPDAFGRAEVLALAEREGVLWIGTATGAYFADVSPPRLSATRYETGGPLAVPDVMGIHISEGAIWAGMHNGGLHRLNRQTGHSEHWFAEPGHPLTVVFTIWESATGDVWLGGKTPTLWRLRPEQNTTDAFPLAPGRDGEISDIEESRHFPGHLWLSTSEAGLIRFDTRQRRVVERYEMASGETRIPARNVWQTAEDETETLWVATSGEGLWRLDLRTGRATQVEAEGCEIDDGLISLAIAPDGALWFGSRDARLFKLNRQTLACRVFGADEGYPADTPGGLFPDARGHVWMSTNVGLFRFDPEAVVFTPFTPVDGLVSSELYWYARDQSASGEIAVGGNGGLTVFDPMEIEVDTVARPVVLSGLRVDGEDRPIPEGGIVLGHTESDVAMDLATLDFRRPGTARYRVRLNPSDNWEDSPPEARYRALAPGHYTFQAAATNRDGFWSEPLTVPIRIRPPFWQTVPFWLMVIGTLGAMGYTAHRYRIAQIQRVERTRRRIADDLHDDIGSKISSVALRLDMARSRAAIPDAERQRLGTLAETARSVVDDLRDTVWLVDAEHDDLGAVVSRMEQFASATLDGRGAVTAPMSVPHRPLAMEPRRDLYLLFTEALHNAVRHSGASHIAVNITASGASVGFRIADDGCGFDPEAVARGRGLTTMRQRADALGGTLTWTPREGGGTLVTFAANLG